MDKTKRNMYGMLCGVAGIIFNIMLFAGKLFAGTISGAISITADAFNNLSDAGSSLITLVGFKMASQQADEKHPYGHARIEYVATLAVSAIILIMGFELFRDSVGKILNPSQIEFSPIIIWILSGSLAVNCIMAVYNFYFGKKIDSSTLDAAGKDSLSDCLATSAVLISTLVAHYKGIQLDGVCGVLVSAFIFYSGISAAKEAIDPLLGEKPEPEFLQKMISEAEGFNENILGIHDVMVHDYGPGHRIISFHAEVPADKDMVAMHDIIDNLERKLEKDLECVATIHMDPIAINDNEVQKLKCDMIDIVVDIDKRITIHDFRVVKGDTHTNLIFEVLVPYKFDMPKEQLTELIEKKTKDKLGEQYFTVVEVDRDNYIHII